MTRASVLIGVLGLVGACTSPSPSAESSGSETGAESGEGCVVDAECGSGWVCEAGECVPDESSETGVSPDLGSDPDPDPGACEEVDDCSADQFCIDGACTSVAAPPECAGPTLTTVETPPQNGKILAIDVIDLDQDGTDELLVWNESSGIALLDGDAWINTSYPPPSEYTAASIAAMPVDDDDIVDIVVNPTGFQVAVGLGIDVGQFDFTGAYSKGLGGIRRVAIEPDRVGVFGMQGYPASGLALMRFDAALEPVEIDLSIDAEDFVVSELDGEPGEEVIAYNRCTAWALDHTSGDAFNTTQIDVAYQSIPGHCDWASADFDGDGRDEAIARESTYFSSDIAPATLLSVFPNQTQPLAPPSFAERELMKLSDVFGWGQAAAVDLDGDARDELLLVASDDGAGTLTWASDDGLIGCQAAIAGIAPAIVDLRPGDLDDDGDDELVLLRNNGALYVRDASWP